MLPKTRTSTGLRACETAVPEGRFAPVAEPEGRARPTPVMLLQGIVRSRFSLGRMARGLADAGFEVYNLGGPSPRLPLEVQVARFRRDLERLGRELSRLHDGEPPVMHGVGHSMGGVVLRVALAQADSIVPGRVVAIATPFLGTRIAEVVCQRRIARLVLGAALRDLTWHSAAIRRLATSAGEEPAGGVILGQRGFSRSCRPPGSTRGSASRTRTARSSLPPPAVTGCGRRPPTSSPSAPATRSWPKGPRRSAKRRTFWRTATSPGRPGRRPEIGRGMYAEAAAGELHLFAVPRERARFAAVSLHHQQQRHEETAVSDPSL